MEIIFMNTIDAITYPYIPENRPTAVDIDDPSSVTDNDEDTTALANEKNINGVTEENEIGRTPKNDVNRYSGNNSSANQAGNSGMLNFVIHYNVLFENIIKKLVIPLKLWVLC